MKASILINNYNYENFVEKAILSALNQTYKNTEVIVYDDGSKDNSLNIINKYSDKIKIIANENYGKGHCWNQINAINKAFEASTGEVIFLMDSDDWFIKDKLEKVMPYFMNNPDLKMVQHKFELIDEDNLVLPYAKRPFISNVNIIESIYKSGRLDLFFSQTSGLCFSKKLLQKILPLKEDELGLICVDLRLTRYAAFEGDVISLQLKLAKYRIHTRNHSANLKDSLYYKEYDDQHLKFFNKLVDIYNTAEFKPSNLKSSYFKVILIVLKSKMSLKEKFNFFKDWYSYLKNR